MAGSGTGPDLWLTEPLSPWDVLHHGLRRILLQRRTRYQELFITESGSYGKALVLDGRWQSSTGDEFLYHESMVHPALLVQGDPRRVLILGGGEGATLREVLRWKTVERAVMVDIDGEVVEACREHLPEMHQGAFDDPRAEVVIGDAEAYLAETDEPWDVILSDLSDPIEDGPAIRLFTREMFERVRSRLSDRGVFVLQGGGVDPEDLAVHARLRRTVESVFDQARTCCVALPTMACTLGFIVAANFPFDSRPDPESIEATLRRRTRGGFRMIDGETVLGLLQGLGHVRRAVEAENRIYTLDDLPKLKVPRALRTEE